MRRWGWGGWETIEDATVGSTRALAAVLGAGMGMTVVLLKNVAGARTARGARGLGRGVCAEGYTGADGGSARDGGERPGDVRPDNNDDEG